MPACGEVPEWTIGAVSKTVVAPRATEGSNPSLSAEILFLIKLKKSSIPGDFSLWL